MPISRMFPAVNNSVPTTLSAAITATDTEIFVTAFQPLPSAPNIITIGTGSSAELVYFTGRAGFKVSGCVRGYNGTTAQDWPQGEIVYRAYTAADHQLFISNINALSKEKLEITGGNASATVVSFEEPEERTEPESGGKLSEIIGRIVKWVRGLTAADVGALAVPDSYAGGNLLGINAEGVAYDSALPVARVPLLPLTIPVAQRLTPEGEFTDATGILLSGNSFGRVGLSISVRKASVPAANELICTVPAGYRPSTRQLFVVTAMPPSTATVDPEYGWSCYCYVDTNGAVRFPSGVKLPSYWSGNMYIGGRCEYDVLV